MQIQSILFSKKLFDADKARYWMSKYGISPIKRVDKTKNFLRYRIKKPKSSYSYRVKKITDGILFVLISPKNLFIS